MFNNPGRVSPFAAIYQSNSAADAVISVKDVGGKGVEAFLRKCRRLQKYRYVG
jgi:hypothetical protein